MCAPHSDLAWCVPTHSRSLIPDIGLLKFLIYHWTFKKYMSQPPLQVDTDYVTESQVLDRGQEWSVKHRAISQRMKPLSESLLTLPCLRIDPTNAIIVDVTCREGRARHQLILPALTQDGYGNKTTFKPMQLVTWHSGAREKPAWLWTLTTSIEKCQKKVKQKLLQPSGIRSHRGFAIQMGTFRYY